MTDVDDSEKYPDKLQLARLPPGTLKRMDALLKPGETRQDFVREATKNEMQRREREAPGFGGGGL